MPPLMIEERAIASGTIIKGGVDAFLCRRRRQPPLLSHTNISIILSEAKLFVAFCHFREDLHNCPREITPRLCDLFSKSCTYRCRTTKCSRPNGSPKGKRSAAKASQTRNIINANLAN